MILAAVVLASSLPLFAGPPALARLCAQATWDAGLRVGAEYDVAAPWALKADVGTTLFSLEGSFVLTYDLFAVWRLLPAEDAFQLDVMAGLPYNMVVFGANAAMVSLGLSLEFGYRWETLGLYLRTGGGYPFFSDKGAWSSGTRTGIVWPDLAVEWKWRV